MTSNEKLLPCPLCGGMWISGDGCPDVGCVSCDCPMQPLPRDIWQSLPRPSASAEERADRIGRIVEDFNSRDCMYSGDLQECADALDAVASDVRVLVVPAAPEGGRRELLDALSAEVDTSAWRLKRIGELEAEVERLKLIQRTRQGAADAEHELLRDASAELTALKAEKDGAYSERNKLVAALAKLMPAQIARHPESDTEWEDDWRWIVFVYGEAGQMSWHIHDSEREAFSFLGEGPNEWDGHDNDEKYRRLERLAPKRMPADLDAVARDIFSSIWWDENEKGERRQKPTNLLPERMMRWSRALNHHLCSPAPSEPAGEDHVHSWSVAGVGLQCNEDLDCCGCSCGAYVHPGDRGWEEAKAAHEGYGNEPKEPALTPAQAEVISDAIMESAGHEPVCGTCAGRKHIPLFNAADGRPDGIRICPDCAAPEGDCVIGLPLGALDSSGAQSMKPVHPNDAAPTFDLLLELYRELDGCTWKREDGGENRIAVCMANIKSGLAASPQGRVRELEAEVGLLKESLDNSKDALGMAAEYGQLQDAKVNKLEWEVGRLTEALHRRTPEIVAERDGALARINKQLQDAQYEYLEMPDGSTGRQTWKDACLAARKGRDQIQVELDMGAGDLEAIASQINISLSECVEDNTPWAAVSESDLEEWRASLRSHRCDPPVAGDLEAVASALEELCREDDPLLLHVEVSVHDIADWAAQLRAHTCAGLSEEDALLLRRVALYLNQDLSGEGWSEPLRAIAARAGRGNA